MQNRKGEKKMRDLLKTLFYAMLIAAFLSSTSIVFADVNLSSFPRLDDNYQVTCPDEDTIMAKARAGEIDTAYDLRVQANNEELQGYGWTLSTNLGYGFHYVGMNCRDVCPDTAGSIQDIGRAPGDSLFPMNLSAFRFALHLIVGGEFMDAAVSETFGWTQVRIDTIPSPAGAPYYNPDLTFPKDDAEAYRILTETGFSNASGYWENTNPDIGPVGEIRPVTNPLGILGCPEAALSTSLMSAKFAAEWQKFFGKMSDGTTELFYYFEYPWTTMSDMSWIQRDQDMWGAGWHVGRDPDYLYYFFHTDFIGIDDYNMPGISDPLLDEYTYAMVNGRFTNGTYITTQEKLIEVAFLAQEMLFYLQPYLIDYCEVTPCVYSPGVTGWIENLGYGSHESAFTHEWIHWTDLTKTGIRFCNPGPPGGLNPGWASTVYEWNILGEIYSGLFTIEPFEHRDVMWAANNYVVEPWSDAGLGVDYGQKVTFYLRQGITWHDGDPVTADDVIFSWDTIANLTLGRFSSIYTTYEYAEKVNDYEVNVYMDATGLYIIYDYAGAALLFPEVIWGPLWASDDTAAKTFEPWNVKYDDHTGSTGHGDLTCLIGTGAFVFIEWDQIAGVAWLKANRPFTIDRADPPLHIEYTGSYFAGNFLREDVNFDGKVNILDLSSAALAFGANPAHERWYYGQCDIDADLEVNIIDLAKIALQWQATTLP